jgi:hypothetical protein
MKWFLRVAVGCFAVSAFIGALHLPALRPVLAWVPSVFAPTSACPVGGKANATAQERESTRQAMLASRLAGLPAPALEVWGLTLGQQRGEVERRLNSSACTPDTSNMVLECTVEASALLGWPVKGTLFVRFDDARRLVGLGSISSLSDADSARQMHGALVASIAKQWSEGRQQGDVTLAMALVPLKTEWAFANATGQVQALRFADDYRVSAELQWVPQGVTASR